jgi:hypothetical protein
MERCSGADGAANSLKTSLGLQEAGFRMLRSFPAGDFKLGTHREECLSRA